MNISTEELIRLPIFIRDNAAGRGSSVVEEAQPMKQNPKAQFTNNMKKAFVYILTNQHHNVLYTGVTSNLQQRILQHRSGVHKHAFTKKYQVHKLVYAEAFDSIVDAIAREKQIKGGSRKKKIDLINKMNPEWRDLGNS